MYILLRSTRGAVCINAIAIWLITVLLVISYLTENKGGTFYTVNYAKSKGVEVINIAE